MFNGGVPDQLHQLIASSRANSVLLPLSSTSSSSFPNSIDIHANYNHESHHQPLLPLQPHFLHPILHQVHHKINHPHDEHHRDEDADTATATAAAARPNNLVTNVDLVMMQSQRSIPELIPAVDHHHHHPWSNDEVLALLRTRSTMENWFPDVTWEHVSRKLAELGFKRSAEKCKEKFDEEQSGYFNNDNTPNNNYYNNSKNYRLFHQLSELEQLYHGENQAHLPPHHQNHNTTGAQKDQRVVENPSELDKRRGQSLEELVSDSTRNETVVLLSGDKDSDEAEKVVEVSKSGNNIKKRKRLSSSSSLENKKKKFDMFKGFCEAIVRKMMAQQEEMHNKLLEDMVKRDQEKVAKEEAWKKQEMDRMNKELEIMAHEQAMAGDRQASIIDFLNKFTSNVSDHHHHQTQFSKPKNWKDVSLNSSSSSSLLLKPPEQSPIIDPCPPISPLDERNETNNNVNNIIHEQPSSSSQNPSNVVLSSNTTTPLANYKPSATSSSNKTQNPISLNDKEDLGKRWPRDEVLALINLRCSLYSSTGESSSDHHKEGISVSSSSSVKAPLWERISQGMSEMGYKRSAKRCKEKWENINKYFRKTKDVNKKRSVDARTCPYFHQLSTLYNKGTTVVSSSSHYQDGQEIRNHSAILPETSQLIIESPADQGERSGNNNNNNVVVHGQEVVLASFDFDF